jgi:hypothetical protein
VGDDDTLFNPLALARWLGNFDAAQPWCVGDVNTMHMHSNGTAARVCPFLHFVIDRDSKYASKFQLNVRV